MLATFFSLSRDLALEYDLPSTRTLAFFDDKDYPRQGLCHFFMSRVTVDMDFVIFLMIRITLDMDFVIFSCRGLGLCHFFGVEGHLRQGVEPRKCSKYKRMAISVIFPFSAGLLHG